MSIIDTYQAYFKKQLQMQSTEELDVESVEQILEEVLPDSMIHPLIKESVVQTHTFYNDTLSKEDTSPFVIEHDETVIAVGCMEGYQQYIYYLNYLEMIGLNHLLEEQTNEYLD